jgi:hypothetical protein
MMKKKKRFGNTAEDLTSRSHLNSSRFHRNTYVSFLSLQNFLKVPPKDKTLLLRSHRVFPRSPFLPFQSIQIKSICQCVLQHPKSILLLFYDIVSNFSNLQCILSFEVTRFIPRRNLICPIAILCLFLVVRLS